MWYLRDMLIPTILASSLSLTPLDVDSSQSYISGEFEQSTYMPGTLIGNWDAKLNPEGTSTLPGYWGGSGNNVIGCDLTPTLGGPYNSSSTGGLEVELDSVNNLMTLNNLHISAFEEAPGIFPVTLGMLYETFRTVQPDSLFPGDIPIDIPLGEGSMTVLRFDQEFDVVAELTTVDSQSWTYAVDIPVIITLELVVLDTPTGPLVSPGVLQLSGTVVQTNTQIRFTGSSSLKSNEVVEDPPLAFENVPFDAPTVLPSGQIASLLLSATAESATTMNSAELEFVAIGSSHAPGDVDGDGVVGVTDLLAIIAVWGPCEGCVEDLNNDGVVNVTDVLEVIGNWT